VGNKIKTTTGVCHKEGGPLLTDSERERLINRSNDSKTRASNDVRVRKKLRSWLQSLDDIALICEYLPEDQITKEITDNQIFFLMNIAKNLMEIRHFLPIVGDIKNPDEWKIVTTTGAEQLANDVDIERSLKIKHVIDDIMLLHGQDNPIDTVSLLFKLESKPEFKKRLTEDDLKAIERVKESCLNCGSPHTYWDRYPAAR
jgi:hypothetical protein